MAKSTLSTGGATSNNLKRKSISFEGGDQVKKVLKAPTSMGNSKKRPLGNNKVYAPPQGKYSSNLGNVGKYMH